MKRFVLGALLLCVVLTSLAFAQEAETSESADSVVVRRAKFVFDDPVGRNIVMFKSQAPLETVIGRTSALYGNLELNLDSLSDTPAAIFEVDLTSFETGIDQRDTDMRSDVYLGTDSFPTARIELLKVTKSNFEVLLNEASVDLTGRAKLAFHGGVDTVNVSIKLTYFEASEISETRLPGDIIKMNAAFDFRMSNFGIVIPEDAFLKLDDRIHVDVDAFGGTDVEPLRILTATRTAAEPVEEMPAAEEPEAEQPEGAEGGE